MIRIGNRTIDTRVLLAPLSACSDLAFRLIAREQGARFGFFEMFEAHSAVHGNPRFERMIRTAPEDRPVAAQLLGTEPELMLKAAEIILKKAPITFLDINAACPARKVYKKGAGACLMNDPAPLYRVLELLCARLPVPVTVKMRVGLSQVDIPLAVRFAKGCESAGASAVSYDAVRAVKDAVKVPVFGSGNILNPPLAKKMLDETGCDGVLIAKGSFGNPFIFRDIETYLATGEWRPATDLRAKLDVLKKHLLLVRQIEGPRALRRIGQLAKICLWYLKGFSEASRMRADIFKSRSEQELLAHIDSII